MKYEWNVSYYHFYPDDKDEPEKELISQNIDAISSNPLVIEFCNRIIDSNTLVDDVHVMKLFVNPRTNEINIKFKFSINLHQYRKMTLLNSPKYALVYSIWGIPLQIPLEFMIKVDE